MFPNFILVRKKNFVSSFGVCGVKKEHKVAVSKLDLSLCFYISPVACSVLICKVPRQPPRRIFSPAFLAFRATFEALAGFLFFQQNAGFTILECRGKIQLMYCFCSKWAQWRGGWGERTQENCLNFFASPYLLSTPKLRHCYAPGSQSLCPNLWSLLFFLCYAVSIKLLFFSFNFSLSFYLFKVSSSWAKISFPVTEIAGEVVFSLIF